MKQEKLNQKSQKELIVKMAEENRNSELENESLKARKMNVLKTLEKGAGSVQVPVSSENREAVDYFSKEFNVNESNGYLVLMYKEDNYNA